MCTISGYKMCRITFAAMQGVSKFFLVSDNTYHNIFSLYKTGYPLLSNVVNNKCYQIVV